MGQASFFVFLVFILAQSVRRLSHHIVLFNPHQLFPQSLSLKMDISGKYLKENLPSATLALSIVLTLTLVLRAITRCKIPSIPIQIVIGLLLGKSFLGREEVIGKYADIYNILFSIENQMVLLHISGFGYLFSIFLIGLKTNLSIPKRIEVALGLIGVLLPFLVGVIIEFTLESHWKLRTQGFKGYEALIFSLSSPSFPSISLLLGDLNLSSETFSRFILASSLISEAAVDAFNQLLKLFYEHHSHNSSTGTLNPPLCFLGLIVFAFLIFRPFLIFICQSSSFSHNSVVVIIILFVLGLCNSIISDLISVHGIIVTLILGFAAPRISNLLEKLRPIEECVNLLLLLYITSLSFSVDLFCINFKEKETIVCGIIIAGVTTCRIFTVIVMTKKLKSCSWREAWATGLVMTPTGVIELSIFAITGYEKVINDSEYALLILSVLFSNCVATITRMVYKQSQESDTSESPLPELQKIGE